MAYIDKDKLAEMINARAEMLVAGKEAFYYIANWLDKLPTADIDEVKHGKWVDSGDCDWRCTNCNEYFTCDIDMHPIYDCGMNYCPNCGAKMDLKE